MPTPPEDRTTTIAGKATWTSCRRAASYMALDVYRDPPPSSGRFTTAYPERLEQIEQNWTKWDEVNKHRESGLVGRLYKLKAYDPGKKDPDLCPPCLAFRGTDFDDMRGIAVTATLRWRVLGVFGWTHDFTYVADATIPPKTIGNNPRRRARGGPVQVPYTRDDLVAMGFRPVPIYAEEGAVRAETAASGSYVSAQLRMSLDLMAKEDGDWLSNIMQGLGRPSPQYQQALDFGKKVIASKILPSADKRVEVTGHSLGGGLAAAVTCYFDKKYPDIRLHGTTFNAAGVHANTVRPASLGDGAIHDFTVKDEVLTTLQSFTSRLPAVGAIFNLAKRTINQTGMPPALGQLIVQRGTWPPGYAPKGQEGGELPVLFPIESQTRVPGYTGGFPRLTAIDGLLTSASGASQFATRVLEWLNRTYRTQAIANNKARGYWFPERIDRTYGEMASLLQADLEPELDVLMQVALSAVDFHGMDFVIAAFDKKFGPP